jgi:hypothetical protein
VPRIFPPTACLQTSQTDCHARPTSVTSLGVINHHWPLWWCPPPAHRAARLCPSPIQATIQRSYKRPRPIVCCPCYQFCFLTGKSPLHPLFFPNTGAPLTPTSPVQSPLICRSRRCPLNKEQLTGPSAPRLVHQSVVAPLSCRVQCLRLLSRPPTWRWHLPCYPALSPRQGAAPATPRPPCAKEKEPYTNQKAEADIMIKKLAQTSTDTGVGAHKTPISCTNMLSKCIK